MEVVSRHAGIEAHLRAAAAAWHCVCWSLCSGLDLARCLRVVAVVEGVGRSSPWVWSDVTVSLRVPGGIEGLFGTHTQYVVTCAPRVAFQSCDPVTRATVYRGDYEVIR